MDAFAHLSVLVSIVLGLGISQLLLGFARWLEMRGAVKAYGPAIAWSGFLLIVFVQTWWAMFGMRHYADWTFLQFTVLLAQPILLFLMASLALPGPGAAETDLKAHFFHNRTWFFGLFLVVLAVSVFKDLVRSGALPSPVNLAFHAALFVTAALAIALKGEAAQRMLAATGVGLILAYVAVLFADLA